MKSPDPENRGLLVLPKRSTSGVGRTRKSRARGSGRFEQLESRWLLAVHGMVSVRQIFTAPHPMPTLMPALISAKLLSPPVSGPQIMAGRTSTAATILPNYVVFTPAGNATPFPSTSGPTGLSPTQFLHAYGLDQVLLPGTSTLADGSGQTIAIVDAYRSPNIRTDLQPFDAQFGLADPAGSAFTIVSQTGGSVSGLATDSNWNLETTLDVEIVHALAPGANILLVEANSSGAGDLQTAVKYASQQPGVVAVSMSFGYPESSTDLMTNSIFMTPSGHQGITFIAATGDSGQPAAYPSYSPNVLAVGGTTLNVDSIGNILSETGWSLNTPNEAATNASGGGISTIESQPGYQHGLVTQSGTMRTAPDVAFDGDPNTGASIYDSSDYGTTNPWIRVGGTSLSAPAWAALIAIADQARASIGLSSLDGATQTLPTIYASSSDFNDILVGNNGYSAGPGYDLVTGLGTPKAVPLVHDLVGPFQVVAATPANGSTVASAPTDFAISFGSPYTTTGIVAGDLMVDGVAADSFDQTSATTITFHYDTSPVTTQGLQTMSIGAGLLTRLADGSPLAAFSATFRYDVLPIAVDATTPVNGSIVTLPLTSVNVHFNEAYAVATIGTSNLTLSQGTVAGFTFVDSQTVQYTLSGVNCPGTLTINMAAGAVTDVYGNAGPAYSGTLYLNGTATAFPTPLAQVNPAGSLVYQSSASGAVLFAGNTVSYTLAVAAGQTLSIVATPAPGLQPRLDLTGPGVNTSATATAPGVPVILETIPIGSTGTYTFTISGASGSTGGYTLAAYLNTALSTAANGGASNQTLATAQNIDGSFVTLAGAAQRAAVVSGATVLAGPNAYGYSAIDVAAQFDEISTTGTAISFFALGAGIPTSVGPTSPIGISFPFYGTTFTKVFVNPHGLITFILAGVSGANTDLSTAPSGAAIVPLWGNINVSGSPLSAGYYKVESTSGGSRLVIEWSHVSFVAGPQTGQVTFEAILNSDGSILFNYLSFDSSLLGAGNAAPTVGIKNSNASGADPLLVPMTSGTGPVVVSGGSLEIARNIAPAVNDYYAFTLAAGESTTLAVRSQTSADMHVTLLDSLGNSLAAGSSPGSGANVNETVGDYVVSTAGTYYALVTGAAGAGYSLVVTRNAAFGAGDNVSFATAADITGTAGALGDIATSTGENWYAINLPANSALALQTYTPGDSTAQFVNNLSPLIQLYSPSNVLLASGQGSPNQTLDAPISAAGTYRIRVLSANSTVGEYFLSAIVNTSPPEVTAIYVSGGANWNPNFYSYLAANGLGDAQLGYRLLGGAGQLLSLPWNNITTLSVVFSQDVTINAADAGLGLVGSPDLPQPTAAFSYDSATHTAQWTSAVSLPLDKYQLDLPSADVTNSFGIPLDGDWSTGTSNFPSGDGASGGGLAFRFNVLPGDVDQNGVVTGVDGNAVRIRMLQDTTTQDYSPFVDVNADGAITGQDGNAVRAQLLQSLPSSDPPSPGQGFGIPSAQLGGQGSEVVSQGAIGGGSSSVATTATTPLTQSAPPPLAASPPHAIHDLLIENLTADVIPSIKSSGSVGAIKTDQRYQPATSLIQTTASASAPTSQSLGLRSLATTSATAATKLAISGSRMSRAADAANIADSASLHDHVFEEFELIAASGRGKVQH